MGHAGRELVLGHVPEQPVGAQVLGQSVRRPAEVLRRRPRFLHAVRPHIRSAVPRWTGRDCSALSSETDRSRPASIPARSSYMVGRSSTRATSWDHPPRKPPPSAAERTAEPAQCIGPTDARVAPRLRRPPRAVCRRPQRDSNPCCRLERAVSWAARRWGPVPAGGSSYFDRPPAERESGHQHAGRQAGLQVPPGVHDVPGLARHAPRGVLDACPGTVQRTGQRRPGRECSDLAALDGGT